MDVFLLSFLRQNPQALRISDTERNQQLQHLTKTCADLAESNRGWDNEMQLLQCMQ